MAVLTGGCACGAVRYEIDSEPIFALFCQCRQCQRASGGGHAASFIVFADSVTLRGSLSFYMREAESGRTVRAGFCGRCGNPIVNETTQFSEKRYFHAASLDDPARFKPQRLVWNSQAQPWDHVDPSLPR